MAAQKNSACHGPNVWPDWPGNRYFYLDNSNTMLFNGAELFTIYWQDFVEKNKDERFSRIKAADQIDNDPVDFRVLRHFSLVSGI
jgi:hypothetical protein